VKLPPNGFELSGAGHYLKKDLALLPASASASCYASLSMTLSLVRLLGSAGNLTSNL
jgi:hypothetical protein